MRIIEEKNLIYIPTWRNNKKLKPVDQIKIEYKYMTGPEKDGLLSWKTAEKGSKGDFVFNNERILIYSIVNIENLEIEIPTKEPNQTAEIIKITTGEQVGQYGSLAGLYAELNKFFSDLNTDDNKKK